MSNAPLDVEVVVDLPCQLGENPLWSPEEGRLYWTDILGRRIHYYEPASRQTGIAWEGRTVGGFTLNVDGSLLLFMDEGRIAILKDGRIVRDVVPLIEDERYSRFNDVIADPEGRVFCGTMPVGKDKPGGPRLGRLYRLDPNGSLTIMLEGVGCSNGMSFTADLSTFYFTDSTPRRIDQFDFHRQSGDLTARRTWYETPDSTDVPDGMTLDRAGNAWAARWGANAALLLDIRGKQIGKITLPAKNVTSMAFGGERLEDLYITSAAVSSGAREGHNAHAGALFRCRPEVGGLPEFRSGFFA